MSNTVHLAPDQWATLERGEPLRLVVPEQRTEIVILSANQFERLQQSSYELADETTIVEEAAPLFAEIDPDAWDAP